jgi:hypothetical protein
MDLSARLSKNLQLPSRENEKYAHKAVEAHLAWHISRVLSVTFPIILPEYVQKA